MLDYLTYLIDKGNNDLLYIEHKNIFLTVIHINHICAKAISSNEFS